MDRHFATNEETQVACRFKSCRGLQFWPCSVADDALASEASKGWFDSNHGPQFARETEWRGAGLSIQMQRARYPSRAPDLRLSSSDRKIGSLPMSAGLIPANLTRIKWAYLLVAGNLIFTQITGVRFSVRPPKFLPLKLIRMSYRLLIGRQPVRLWPAAPVLPVSSTVERSAVNGVYVGSNPMLAARSPGEVYGERPAL